MLIRAELISPEYRLQEYKNATYKELVKLRNELLEEIREFEETEEDFSQIEMMHSRPESIYLWNLQALKLLIPMLIDAYERENSTELTITQGDITQFSGDAIVNAANSSLLGGGGVDGAIHRAAGRELFEECETLGGCETGNAKITKGYNLKAKYVIHTVGPIYSLNRKEECRAALKSCYQKSLELAKENGCESVAFPLISAGVYGYPKNEALEVAVETIEEFGEGLDCSIILFDKEACDIAKKEFSEYWG